jgi:hypothetical protein
MSSCGYTHALCRKDGEEEARRSRRAARSFWRSGQAKDHADMRLTCGSPVVGCVLTHLKLVVAARGPPKTGFEPRRGRGIVFRNSRILLSAGRRACKFAAKPATPGVICSTMGLFAMSGLTSYTTHDPRRASALATPRYQGHLEPALDPHQPPASGSGLRPGPGWG